MNKLTLFCILLLTIFGSCKKVVNTINDKEVTLDFHLDAYTTSQTTFETLPEYTWLLDFDKRDYPGVDSIVFAAGLGVSEAVDTSYVRLFNVTDSVEIASSNLSSDMVAGNRTLDFKQTNNIYHSLPDKRIDLAIQIRTIGGSIHHFAFISEPYLKLWRKTH